MDITIDIETIPSQRQDIRTRMEDEAAEHLINLEIPDSIAGLKTQGLREQRAAEWMEKQHEKASAKTYQDYRQTALSGDYGEIVCICWAIDDGPVKTLSRSPNGHTEHFLLSELWASLAATAKMTMSERKVFVGFNVEFDLRFLFKRSAILGVRPTVRLPYNSAVWRGDYVDLMYEWCGARDRIKLTALCDIFGVEGNDTIDGSMVYDRWLDNDIETIERHCVADVERVRMLGKRLRFEA